MLSNYKKNQSFEVKSICRADLADYLSWEDIQRHFGNDWEMEQLADKLGDALQDDYWSCLRDTLQDYFELKLK